MLWKLLKIFTRRVPTSPCSSLGSNPIGTWRGTRRSRHSTCKDFKQFTRKM